MRVLITGGAGFIGSNLVQKCLDEQCDVVVVDDLSNGHREFLPSTLKGSPFSGDRCGFIHGDFAHSTVLSLVKQQRFDVVFHLAALPRVSYSVEHPLETNDTNVNKSLELIDACRGNIKRFVFASSSSVYGGVDINLGPVHENCPRRPQSPYALQKSIIEDYLYLYGNLYGFDSACMRFFNVFGPNQLGTSPYATAVSAWLTAIKQGKPMRSDGSGDQSRDMCYVDNVTDACFKAAVFKGGPLQGRCYNVACGERVTNNEILDFLMKRFPGSTKVNAPWRPGDVMHTHADVFRAKDELGYVPTVKFWEGLDRTIRWVEGSDLFTRLAIRV